MKKLANCEGEVVAIAVDRARGLSVACTSSSDAAVIVAQARDEPLTALVRSALQRLNPGLPLDVRAAFVAGRLYLKVGALELNGGGTSVLLAVDLDARTVLEVHRDLDAMDAGIAIAPVGIDDRFVLVETFDEDASAIVAYELPSHTRCEVLRPAYPGADGGRVAPAIVAMGLVPEGRRLYLAAKDPDNCDGNRLLVVSLDADCRPLGPPESLLRVKDSPYSPDIGGLCANPFDGGAACLMYPSEWEGILPITRLPREGDPLPVADLHLVRPGAEPRRLDVLGYLETNLTFYDREHEVRHLPHRFRYRFDFNGAQNEVTPLLPLGPDRYLATLFRGSLLDVRTDFGAQSVAAQFEPSITALSLGPDPGTVLVGLADGSIHAVEVPAGP